MPVNKTKKPAAGDCRSTTHTYKKSPSFQETKTSIFYLLPFVGVLAFIPLIIRYALFDNNLSDQYWHSSKTQTGDIFLYYKSVFLIIFSVILLLFLVYALMTEQKKLRYEIEYIPLTVYLAFVILSTFASSNMYFSIHGIENHFEPVWVLIGYVILVFYGSVMADNTKAIKFIIYGWLIGTWVLMLIGVFQAFKLDIFTTEFIKKIVLPASMQTSALKLNFELGQVYITLYNPNYIGYFAALTIPTFLVLTIYADKIWKKLLFAATVAGVFICLVGSSAKNGLIAVAASLLLLILLFRRQLLQHWKIVIAAVLVFIALFIGVNALRGNAMINSIRYNLAALSSKEESSRKLNTISCEAKDLKIVYEGNSYYFHMSVLDDVPSMYMTNAVGTPLKTSLSEDGSTLSSADDAFPFEITATKVSAGNNQTITCAKLLLDGYSYTFSNQLSTYGGGSGFYYLNASGKWVTIETARTALFTNKPKLFSNRGYIWARTIPLLKDHIFLGSGPDTFVFSFPNNDYVNSAYVGFLNQIVTKPHSLYLQIGVQTGVISLLGFIAFFVIYFIRSLCLYWKHPLDTIQSKLGIGLAAATFGYMVSGITNDSTITYACVFFGLMGVGIALNRLVRAEYEGRPQE